VTNTATNRGIEAVWRMEPARLLGALMRMVRDVSVAEDPAQDALVGASHCGRSRALPNLPGARLMPISTWRAIDHFRRSEHPPDAERPPSERGLITMDLLII
jgi:RNA polymerase sigma-70 factor (ECF subfamily)